MINNIQNLERTYRIQHIRNARYALISFKKAQEGKKYGYKMPTITRIINFLKSL